jgi:electron transport complex protein RnfE
MATIELADTRAPADGLGSAAAAGFWRNNMALVQMLGLCPLLAVTTSVVNGLALGLATAGVLTLTNTVISAMRRALIPFVRIPLFVLIIAALVTCIDLLMNAVLDDLHQILGLFIPLIVTNCAVLAQAETVASRKPVSHALVTGLATGLGFCAVLVVLGGMRELLGHGTLFAGMPMLLGSGSGWLEMKLPYGGMLVAILPPGAFFGMAALLALRNHLTRERPAPVPAPLTEAAAEAPR